MRAASSSRCCQSCSRQAKKTSLRAMSGVSRQAGKAAAAAATAASTSGAPPRGTRAMTCPVAGLYTGPVCSRQRPRPVRRRSSGTGWAGSRGPRWPPGALRSSWCWCLLGAAAGRVGHDGRPAWIGQTRVASCSTDRRHYGAHRARSGRRLPSLPDGPVGPPAGRRPLHRRRVRGRRGGLQERSVEPRRPRVSCPLGLSPRVASACCNGRNARNGPQRGGPRRPVRRNG